VPIRRVRQTADVFAALDGDVTNRFHPGDDHGITDEELDAVGELVDRLLDDATG